MLNKRRDELAQEVEVTSAGCEFSPEGIKMLQAEGKFWDKPLFGLPPHPYVIESMNRRGLDVSKSRSKELAEGMIAKADLVIAFNGSQKESILSLYPPAHVRVFTLQELVGYTGYLANTDYSNAGWVPNDETRSWTFPDSFHEATITEIEHMLWWGVDRIIDFLKRKQ